MIHELLHSLRDHKISLLKSTNTDSKLFRELVNELSQMLVLEASKNLPTKFIKIETPLQSTIGKKISTGITIVPVLRAGLGMLDACLQILPFAKSGFIGLARNEKTLDPESYYEKFPTGMKNDIIFLIDPMLATGGSLLSALKHLKNFGIEEKNIKILTILAAPEGINKITATFSGDIFIAQIDERLNKHGYIVPGLGDAGDRIFKS